MPATRLASGEHVSLDGRLDEPVWTRAQNAGDFVQVDPDNGKPATEQTEVRIAFDANALYIGVIAHDSEGTNRLVRYQKRRDELLQSDDKVQWTIDTFLDGRSGYFFETNPSGLMGDALLTPAGQNRQWDGVWTLRVQRSDVGWTLEVEIPFSTLNFDPSGTAWGINLDRKSTRLNSSH